MYSHMKPSHIRLLLWTAVILWMVLIFFLSAQEAAQSSALSGSAIRQVAAVIHPGFHTMPVEQQNRVVESYQHAARKTAHTLAYLVLGVLCMTAFFQYPARRGHRFAAALAVCVGYAGTDEIHQLFVPGRSGQLTDVCIDACGAALGICAALLIHRIWSSKRTRTQRHIKT